MGNGESFQHAGSIHAVTRNPDFSGFCSGFISSGHSASRSKDGHQQPKLMFYRLRDLS